MDILLPPWLNIAAIDWRYLEKTGISFPEFGGPVRTASLGGDRLGASIEFTPVGKSTTQQLRDLRQGQSFRTRLRGQQNRAYITNPARRTDYTFPGTELVSDNTFASGGLAAYTQGSEYSGAVVDRVARLTRTGNTGSARPIYRTTAQLAALTANLPYILRAFVYGGRGPITDSLELRAGSSNGGTEYGSAAFTEPGMLSLPFISLGTAISATLLDVLGAHARIGDYIDVPYFSLSRCALADAGVNLFRNSSDASASGWTPTRCSIGTTPTTLPDGSTGIVNFIQEDGTPIQTHLIEQDVAVTSDAQDMAIACAFKASNRTWARLSMLEGVGPSSASAYINLSSGALGTVAGGTNWANQRAYVTPLGDGWYLLVLIARKTNAATTVTGRVWAASVDNDPTFSGANQNSIRFWLPTIAPASMPIRLVATGSLALTAGTANASEMYANGLTANAAAQLLADHEFEVITSYGSELKILEAPVDGDALGRGLLQFSPPLRGTISNGAPIIIHEPFGFFKSASESISSSHQPGLTTANLDVEEGV